MPFFVLSLFAQADSDTAALSSCKRNLLQTLRLEGLQKASEATDMVVCPVVAADNCCSGVDELKIYKSWTSYSLPKLEKYARDFQDIHKNVMSLDKSFKRLDSKFIKYHYTSYNWIKQKVNQCINAKFLMEQSSVDQISPFRIRRFFRRSFTKLYTKKLLEQNPAAILDVQGLMDTIAQVMKSERMETVLMFSYGADTMMTSNLQKLIANVFAALNSTIVNTVQASDPTKLDKDLTLKALDMESLFQQVMSDLQDPYYQRNMQYQIGKVHMKQIVHFIEKHIGKYLKSTQEYIDKPYHADLLVADIVDSVRKDKTLQKYLSSMIKNDDLKITNVVATFLHDRIFKALTTPVQSSQHLASTSSGLVATQ